MSFCLSIFFLTLPFLDFLPRLYPLPRFPLIPSFCLSLVLTPPLDRHRTFWTAHLRILVSFLIYFPNHTLDFSWFSSYITAWARPRPLLARAPQNSTIPLR